MHVFYKKYQRLINVFFATSFVILTLIATFSFRSSGIELSELNQQKIIHAKVQKVFSKELEGDCKLFKTDDLINQVSSGLKLFDFKLDIVKENILTINQLIFERITFRTFQTLKPNQEVISYGYMVIHSESKKCFGIL